MSKELITNDEIIQDVTERVCDEICVWAYSGMERSHCKDCPLNDLDEIPGYEEGVAMWIRHGNEMLNLDAIGCVTLMGESIHLQHKDDTRVSDLLQYGSKEEAQEAYEKISKKLTGYRIDV